MRGRATRIAILLAMGFFANLGASRPAVGATLHVVVAADVRAAKVGADMKLGREAIEAAILVNAPKSMCNIVTVASAGLGRASMLQAVAGLRVRPGEDAVLFYYLGHGAYSPKYGTYTTTASDAGRSPLFLSEVRQAIAAKSPRFGMAIFDCCNTLRPVAGEPRPALPAMPVPVAMSPLFLDLFFSRPGLMTVTSSAPGEYSIVVPEMRDRAGGMYHRGSLFTNVLTSKMLRLSDERMGWDRFLELAQKDVDEQYQEHCRGGVIPPNGAQPVYQARQTISSRSY